MFCLSKELGILGVKKKRRERRRKRMEKEGRKEGNKKLKRRCQPDLP